MKVALVNGPRFDAAATRKTSAPMALACLGAYARRAGHEVFGVDGILLGQPAKIAAAVAGGSPDVVGLTTNTNDRLAALKTLRHIRQALPNALIVVGGPHFSYTAENALAEVDAIDAVVVGEGELTFAELLSAWPDRARMASIDGLVWRGDDGQVVRNRSRAVMEDLSDLPPPAWDLFDLRQYDLRMIDADATPVMGVLTTRGCPYRCAFCANSLDRRLRKLQPALAVDELESLQRRYGISGFTIFDDAFLADKGHAAALCEEILRRNLKITWRCGIRARGLDDELLKLMIRAGCKCVSFGVETGTDEVLAAVNKNVTTAHIEEAFQKVAQAGFERIQPFLIVGLPGETPQTIDRTVEFLRKLRGIVGEAWRCDSLIGQLPLIYPGTELEQIAIREGTHAADFSWNRPFIEPKRYLPLVNRRYWAVPHYENPHFRLDALCRHLKQRHWNELSQGRRKRYRLAPLKKVLCKVGIG